MGFSTATYDAVINKIESAIPKIESDTNTFVSEVASELGWIPFIGGEIKAALRKLVSLVDELLQKLAEYLKPALIPTMFWDDGNVWGTIGGNAAQVASTIQGQIQAKGNEWQGIAGGKYANGVPAQASAAQAISSLAGSTGSACTSLAVAGYTFYMAILVAEAAVAGGVATCAAAGWTGVGAIVGLIVAVGGALIGIGVAVGSLVLGVDSSVRSLQGLIGPSQSFPGNAWPIATAQ
jgi:hypothetical protein